MTSQIMKSLAGRISLAIAVALLLGWSLGPIYWAMVTSLTPPTELISDTAHYWPVSQA